MYCKEISLKNGAVLEDVHINKCKDYPEFIEVESEMDNNVLVNKNYISIIVPHDMKDFCPVQII